MNSPPHTATRPMRGVSLWTVLTSAISTPVNSSAAAASTGESSARRDVRTRVTPDTNSPTLTADRSS